MTAAGATPAVTAGLLVDLYCRTRRFGRACERTAFGLAVVVCLVICAVTKAEAQRDSQQVKAAFLVNFVKFVTWPDTPASADGPIVIAVLGADDFARVVARELAGQWIGGRTVAVRTLRTLPQLHELRDRPHLLFIGGSEHRNLAAVLRALEGQAVLTVGDSNGFGSAGVVLNLYTSDKRIRFEANTAAATRAGLKLSAHLLRIARIVG